MGQAERSLPKIPHETDLSTDLKRLTMVDPENEGPYSEHIADRNISGSHAPQMSSSPPDSQHKLRHAQKDVRRLSADQSTSRLSRWQPMDSRKDPYSEGVADYNLGKSQSPIVGGLADVPAPLNMQKRSMDNAGQPAVSSAAAYGTAKAWPQGSLAPDAAGVSDESQRTSAAVTANSSPRGSIDRTRQHIKRSSLAKPLPQAPTTQPGTTRAGDASVEKHDSGVESALGLERGYFVKDADTMPDLQGIVDLRKTEDTTLHERWAPGKHFKS